MMVVSVSALLYEEQYLFTNWRKLAELQPAASQRRSPAAGQRRNAAAPRGGGRSCRQRLRSCSELLGRPRGAALSARPLRNRLRSVGLRRMGASAAILACQLLDAIPVAAPACWRLRGTAGTSACRRRDRSAAEEEFWGCYCGGEVARPCGR